MLRRIVLSTLIVAALNVFVAAPDAQRVELVIEPGSNVFDICPRSRHNCSGRRQTVTIRVLAATARLQAVPGRWIMRAGSFARVYTRHARLFQSHARRSR